MRYILLGDGLSPHLLKWARTLHEVGEGQLELGVLSSRGLLPEFEPIIPPQRRLLLNTQPRQAGGNIGLLRHLPRAARWLKDQQPDVLHAHYLTSHGALAWLPQRLWRVPGLLVSSAWGSDILVTPQRSALARQLTAAILKGSAACTADSRHMAREMLRLGAREVDVFPFGLNELPPPVDHAAKDPDLFFSNRGLEPLYRIDGVLRLFAAVVAQRPRARLVVANQGSQRAALQALAATLGIERHVTFTGLLRPAEQARWYERAQWHLSLPESDSVSVSVLEAMAFGCIPVLSDLPANRELVTHGLSGWVVQADPGAAASSSEATSSTDTTASADWPPEAARQAFIRALPELLERAADMAEVNRQWVQRHGLFAPHVRRFLQGLPLNIGLKGPA